MLKRSVIMFTAILLFCGITQVSASSALSEHEEECYAVAMVGYDSVINSNLGLPLDEVINTFVSGNDSVPVIDIYQDFLLMVVMWWSGFMLFTVRVM